MADGGRVHVENNLKSKLIARCSTVALETSHLAVEFGHINPLMGDISASQPHK